MIYLYTITEPVEQPLEALCGVDMAPLAYLRSGSLTAVVSVLDAPSVAPTPRRLWQHEQVVEALMTLHTVVPARFATVFADDAALLARVDASRARFEGDLERLRGCVELGLRVMRIAAPPVGGDGVAGHACPELRASEKNGRAYDVARRAAVQQRHTRRRRIESLGEMINRVLVEHSVDHALHVVHAGSTLVKASYLVKHEHLSEMQCAVRRLIEAYPHLHFLCTGPWPPYHFVQPIEPAGQRLLAS